MTQAEDTNPELPELIETSIINDPNTGHHDALFELWYLGDNTPEMTETVTKILEDQAVANSNMASGEQKHMAGSRALIHIFGIMGVLKEIIPKEAQYVVLGKVSTYGVGVTYANPENTPPKQHPEIDKAVKLHAGEEYLTLKVRPVRRKRSQE